MNRNQLVLLVALFGISLAAACNGDGGPSAPEDVRLTGTRTGSASFLTVTFVLSETSAGAIGGSGSLSNPDGTFGVTVFGGTHAGSAVSFTFGGTGFEDANFTGTLSGSNVLNGTLNGS
jgi:hypothetical protein